MGKPAARLTDMHVCPMVTPGLPPIPHVGGPIIGPGCPTVLIQNMPASVVGDMCMCVGPPDSIIMGSTGVFFGGMPAARMGDPTAHGGTITLGCPTVLIGETSSGSAGSSSAPPDSALNAGQNERMGSEANVMAQAIKSAAISGEMYVKVPITKMKKPKNPVKQIPKSDIACLLQDEDGTPMSDIKYEITLPDGSVRKGSTDSNGKISITGIPPGTCKVSFPDLHADEWS
jgi:uncharacterized Zn-binding protein involved in type VI secretion